MTSPTDSPPSATIYQLPQRPPSRFKRMPGAFLPDLPPLKWLVKDVIPTAGLVAIYGPPSSGKSFLALDLAAAVATGGTWFGHLVKPAPVVYVALEGEGGFPKRLKAWEKHNQRLCPEDLSFVLGQDFTLSSPADVDDLAEVCPEGCVIMIDTLNRAAPNMDENSSRDMGIVLAACKRLARLTGGVVILIHHTGKDEARGLRGHSSLLAALDASIEVSRSIDQRAWKIAKSKDDNDEVWHGFRLFVESVDVDEDGDEVTSCAVEPVGAVRTAAAPNPQGKVQKLILEPIRALLASSGHVGYPGVPDGVFAIPLSTAIQRAAEMLVDVEPRRRGPRAKEAIDGLVKRRLLGCNADFVWRID